MKKNTIYPIASLLATAFILIGCNGTKQATVKPTVQKAQAVQMKAPKPSGGISLSELKQTGAVENLTFKAKDTYALDEAIQFVVNTGEEEGYLYLVYLDDKGETGLLYPNANSPLSEMGGEFLFPQDFGNMNIRATKNCKSCKEEKTSIYALLSKRPITDIDNITKSDLLSLTSPTTGTRAISLELGNNTKTHSNFNVGKIDFLVK